MQRNGISARQTDMRSSARRPVAALAVVATMLLIEACGGDGDIGVSQRPACSPSVVARAASLSELKEKLRNSRLPIESVRRQREGAEGGTRVLALEDSKGRLIEQVRVWKRDDGRWVARQHAIACQ